MFVSVTHPLVFALDSFRGCCVNCLLLSLLWFCSLLTSSIPSLIYLSSLYYKGTGSRRCTNSCTQCRVSSNFPLWCTIMPNTPCTTCCCELPLPVFAKFKMFWFSGLALSLQEAIRNTRVGLNCTIRLS